MQQTNDMVKEILTQASRQIELLTGSTVVALFINQRQDKVVKRCLDDLALAVCETFGISMSDLVGDSRKGELPFARHLFFWYAYNEFGFGPSKLGRKLNRDHTTAIHGIGKIQDFLDIKDFRTTQAMLIIKRYLNETS